MGRPGRRGGGGRRGGAGARAAGGVFGRAAAHAFRVPKGRSGGGPGGGGRRPSSASRNSRTPARRQGNDRANARPNDTKSTTKDPIDVVTGEVLLTQTDVDLPAALPLVLERTHVSTYRAGALFGVSWASTLDQHLQLEGDGVYFLAADATVLKYPHAQLPNIQFRPVEGPQWPLTLTSDGGYTLTDPRLGRTLHFPAPGEEHGWSRLPLIAITDRNGNRIDFVYENQVLTEIRHSGGYRIAVDTAPVDDGPDRRVTALRLLPDPADGHPDGITLIRYGYDADGHLAEVVNSSGQPLRFSYDDNARLTGWVDRNGFWYRYEYDEEGRAVRGVGKDGYLNSTLAYDPANRTTVVTDSLGHATTYRYNEQFQVVEETDPLGNTVRREWDRFDRLLSFTDPLGRTTRYTYDDYGNVTSVTRPDGAVTSISYNELMLPVEVTEPGGTVWRQTYDQRGNLTSVTDPSGAVTSYDYDEHGRLTALTDPSGARTQVVNNAAGLPIAVTDPSGAVIRLQRDAMGWVVAVTDPAGGVTRYGWTLEGRLSWRILPDGATEKWTYDAEGNEIAYTDPLGQVTRTEIGPFDQPVAHIDPDGTRLEFAYDRELRLTAVTNPRGAVWRYDYDAAGNLIAETDFNGRVLRYGYDAAGQLVQRVNGAGQTATYVRDALGQVIERRTGDGAVHRFAYDPLGRLLRAQSPNSTLEYTRDPLGRILTETVDGRTLRNEYDALGRRTRRITPTGAVSRWTYDARGLPQTLATPGGGLSFQYDAMGRETARFLGPGAAISQRHDPAGRLIAQAVWAYDQPGRGDTARSVHSRVYRYRADGIPVEIRDTLRGDIRFGLDPVGRVTAVQAQGWTERYAYDTFGNPIQADAPGDEDVRGPREYQGTLVRRAGRTVYEHDAQGRLVRTIRRTLSGQTRQWTFVWDADDRLVQATTPEGTWRYTYDPIGRRTSKQRVDQSGAVVDAVWFSWDGSRLAEQVTTTPDGRVTATSWDWEPDGYRPATQVRRSWAKDAPQAQIDTAFYAIVSDLVGTPTELVAPNGRIAWRNVTTLWGTSIAAPSAETDCPLRFPGQYHDEETGLNYNYFRYYDPASGGYASPDPIGLGAGPNHHAYVTNPTCVIDPLGLAPYKSDPAYAKDRLNPKDRASYDRIRDAVDRVRNDPQAIRRHLRTGEIDRGLEDGVWRQRMYAGTALERAVAADPAVRGDPNITHLGAGKPGKSVPDFRIGERGYAVDVTGASQSSINEHMNRTYYKHIDQIITYPTMDPDFLKKIFF